MRKGAITVFQALLLVIGLVTAVVIILGSTGFFKEQFAWFGGSLDCERRTPPHQCFANPNGNQCDTKGSCAEATPYCCVAEEHDLDVRLAWQGPTDDQPITLEPFDSTPRSRGMNEQITFFFENAETIDNCYIDFVYDGAVEKTLQQRNCDEAERFDGSAFSFAQFGKEGLWTIVFRVDPAQGDAVEVSSTTVRIT